MSTASLAVSPNNPVTSATISDILRRQFPGVQFSERDRTDYLLLVQALHTTVEEINALPDWSPRSDLDRFPRHDVRKPEPLENPYNAWTMRCRVQDSQPNPDGILRGLTFAAKDNMAVAGVITNNGTAASGDWKPSFDAEVVKRALEAGGTLLGKATTENNSCSPSSHSSVDGPVQNPYSHGRSTGGSSSGCAALVASEAVDFALGGDQGGSIRMPASFCGIVGLKPTYGLIPYTGVMSLETCIDHVGPMTRTVLQNAMVLAAVAGDDGLDDRQGPGVPLAGQTPMYHQVLLEREHAGVKGLRIGILKEAFDWPHMDSRVAKMVRSAASAYDSLGATVTELSVPRHKLGSTLWAVAMRMSSCQALVGRAAGRKSVYLNELDGKRLPWQQPQVDATYSAVLNLIIGGTYAWDTFGPSLYGKAMNLVQETKLMYDEALQQVDVLVLPTCPFLPTRHAQSGGGPIAMVTPSVGQGVNTAVFNATGHPGLNIPVGMLAPEDGTADWDVKLPVGMQLVGRFFDEATLYQAGHAWEKAFDWRSRS